MLSLAYLHNCKLRTLNQDVLMTFTCAGFCILSSIVVWLYANARALMEHGVTYSTVHKKRINLYDNLKKAKLGQVNGGVIYIEYTYIATNTKLSSPQIVQ